MYIYDIKHFKGNESNYLKIKARLTGARKALHITLDMITGNVNVHEWYLLTESELEKIVAMIKESVLNDCYVNSPFVDCPF